MKNMNCLHKVLLVSIIMLPSTSCQLSGMSYLFGKRLEPLKVFTKTCSQKAKKGFYTGFEYMKSGVQLSASSVSDFVRTHPTLAKSIMVGAITGISLIHPAIRGLVNKGSWGALGFARKAAVKCVWPVLKGCYSILSGVSTLIGMGSDAQAIAKYLSNEDKRALHTLVERADEFMRNVKNAADYQQENARALTSAPCPVDVMRPILSKYENAVWSQRISAACDEKNISYENGKVYSVVTLYAEYMNYLSDIAHATNLTEQQTRIVNDDIRHMKNDLIGRMEEIRGFIAQLISK